MRAFWTAAAIVAILTVPCTVPCFAQGKGGSIATDPDKPRPGEQPRPVVDEKKYKSAVEVMGDSKQTYDPWGTVREKPKTK
jgi:hypothetical protein